METYGDSLHSIVGATLTKSWIAWDLEHDEWFNDEPVIFQFNDCNFEACFNQLSQFALTSDSVDINAQPNWMGCFDGNAARMASEWSSGPCSTQLARLCVMWLSLIIVSGQQSQNIDLNPSESANNLSRGCFTHWNFSSTIQFWFCIMRWTKTDYKIPALRFRILQAMAGCGITIGCTRSTLRACCRNVFKFVPGER